MVGGDRVVIGWWVVMLVVGGGGMGKWVVVAWMDGWFEEWCGVVDWMVGLWEYC